MAGQKVHWDEKKLQHHHIRCDTSYKKPFTGPQSPYPHNNGLSDTDDEPSAVKSVLSIDGGGISGYSSLVMMKALMEEIGKIERARDPKAISSVCSPALGPRDGEVCAAPTSNGIRMSEYRPCHYFDYIAGLGTGGIVAMLLGRYRMSVCEATERYRDICATAVEQKRMNKKKGLSRDHKPTWPESHTKKLIPAWTSTNEDRAHLQSDRERCRTIVCGCDSKLQLLRSYAFPNPQDSVNDIILQCVSPAKHCYNNPSRTVLKEVSSQLDETLSKNKLIDLLSVGSALCERVDLRADSLQYQMSRQTKRVHDELSDNPKRFDLGNYCRLNARGDGLQGIGADEWCSETSDPPTLRRIERATDAYLHDGDTAAELHRFATRLVDRRRLRAETLQWERWALGVVYRCPALKCQGWNERFVDSVGFWAHTRNVHGVQPPDYEGGSKREYNEYEARGRTR